MRKKLLTAPLCFLLLATLVTISITISEEENPFPAYENGVWHDGPWREDCYIPPGTTPNVTVVGPPPSLACLEEHTTSVEIAGFEEQKIQVNILLALEETYYPYYYYTPYGKMNGFLYALLQMERASQYFEQVFNVELVVIGAVTWRQDEEQDIYALKEVYKETGFKHGMTWNGYTVEALVAWTLKLKYGIYEGNGIALLYDWFANKWYWTCMVRYNAYWMDDNTVQHEVSHLLNATDGKNVPGTEYPSECFQADCVMSYRTTLKVTEVEEDGIIWKIPNEKQPIGITWLTNNWCERSQEEMNKWKWLYAKWDYIDPPWQGDC